MSTTMTKWIETLNLSARILTLLVSVVITLIYLWQSREYKQTKKKRKTYAALEKLATFSLCSIILFNIFLVVRSFDKTQSVTIAYIYCINTVGLPCVQLFYVFRLKSSFKGSTFEISSKM